MQKVIVTNCKEEIKKAPKFVVDLDNDKRNINREDDESIYLRENRSLGWKRKGSLEKASDYYAHSRKEHD